jgi:hypothetical protein
MNEGIIVIITLDNKIITLNFSPYDNLRQHPQQRAVCLHWYLYFRDLGSYAALFQLYHDSQFYWWRKPEYPEKTTDLLQVIHKLYHIRCIEYTSSGWNSNSQR